MDSRNNNIYPGYEQIEIDRLSYYINIGDTNNAVALAQKLAANNIKIKIFNEPQNSPATSNAKKLYK